MPQVETVTPSQNTGFLPTRSTDQVPVLPALPVAESANSTPTPPPSLRTNGTVAPTLPSSIDVASIDLSKLGSEEARLRQLLASDPNARATFIERLKSDPTVQATIEELRKLQGTILSEQVFKALEAKLKGEGSDAFSINQNGEPDKMGAWLSVQGAQQLLRSLQELAQKVSSGTMTTEDAQLQTTLKLLSGGAAGIVQGPAVLTADYIMQNMTWEWLTYRTAHASRLENQATLVSTNTNTSLIQQLLKIEEERRQQLRRETATLTNAVYSAPDAGQALVTHGIDITALRRAIIGKESNGNPRAVNPDSGALGLGQVMPDNLPSWSREILGREVSVQEFLASAELQLRIINGKLAQYVENEAKPGRSMEEIVRRVASVWYSGQSSLWNNTRRQFYGGNEYPSISSYTSDIYGRFVSYAGNIA